MVGRDFHDVSIGRTRGGVEMLNAENLASQLAQTDMIDPQLLARAARLSEQQGVSLLYTLFDLGAISAARRAEIAASVLALPIITAAEVPDRPVLPDLLPAPFLTRIGALPLRATAQDLHVAMIDPFDEDARNTLRMATGRALHLSVVDATLFETAAEALMRGGEGPADPVAQSGGAGPLDLSDDLEEAARQAPVVREVKGIIDRAIRARASDIHVEPFADRLVLRYRIDGVLQNVAAPDQAMTAALISRLKIMARLNISERRLPQDGRFSHVCDGRTVDLRMSTVPTADGESVVLRLLDKDRALVDFDQLGMSAAAKAQMARLLAHQNGIILLTGPTGSGKSTTLYAAMRALNGVERKILSIEDPVEYKLTGVNQIAVKPEISLSFASLLRSALRQDPDIIVVGEMRDSETAEIATRAALTGHLVLSTVHTNTAAGAVTRLRDMGVPDFILGSTLRAAIAQRLVRRVCPACASRRPASAQEAALFRRHLRGVACPADLPVSAGCEQCNHTGYRGRLALYEVLEITPALHKQIARNADEDDILRAAADDHVSLLADGLSKVAAGLTTVEEIARLVGLGVGDG